MVGFESILAAMQEMIAKLDSSKEKMKSSQEGRSEGLNKNQRSHVTLSTLKKYTVRMLLAQSASYSVSDLGTRSVEN
jgi:hypothetical protein